MSDAAAKQLTIEQLRGFKQLRRVATLLSALHEVGCARDKAGNRELFFDDYVLLILLYLFNPLIDSMRTLQQAASLPEMRQRLGIKSFSLGSFSESCRVFDPDKLQQVVEQLWGDLRPIDREELLKQLPGKLTLVDATVINTLCTIAEAMYLPTGKDRSGGHRHAWRLHVQLDVDHHVPTQWEITDPRNTGKSDEKSVLRRKLQPGHTYVMDRWYAQFVLWNDIKAAGSSYVCRVRDNSVYTVLEDRPLDKQARAAGIISDQVVQIGLSKKPSERAESSHAADLHPLHAAPQTGQGQGPAARHRPDQRRRAADRHRPAGRAGPRDCVPVPVPLDDRGVLPLLQADPGLPAPAEHQEPGDPDPGLRGGDLLHADQQPQRPQAQQAHGGADGLLPAGPGDGCGCAEGTEPPGQHRRETGGQGRAVEKDGVVTQGPLRDAMGRR